MRRQVTLRRTKRRVTSYCGCGATKRATREHMLKECRRYRRWRPREWERMSVTQILGDGKEERMLELVKESGVGIRPPGEILDGDGSEQEERMDPLNEFMDFFRD